MQATERRYLPIVSGNGSFIARPDYMVLAALSDPDPDGMRQAYEIMLLEQELRPSATPEEMTRSAQLIKKNLIDANPRGRVLAAPRREIEAWLAELSVIVARRGQPEFDEVLRLEAYAGRLQSYPADVAKAALLGRTPSKFGPAKLKVSHAPCTGPRRRRGMMPGGRSSSGPERRS